MTLKTTLKLGDEDPNWETVLDEAFNRVRNYTPELVETGNPFRSSFNKILINREFSLEDVQVLKQYSAIVALRVKERVKILRKTEQLHQVADSIEQAVKNLEYITSEFTKWVASSCKSFTGQLVV